MSDYTLIPYSNLLKRKDWQTLSDDEIVIGNPDITKSTLTNGLKTLNPKDVVLELQIATINGKADFSIDNITVRNASKNNLCSLFNLGYPDEVKHIAKYDQVWLWWD